MNITTVKTNLFWTFLVFCNFWLWDIDLTAQSCFDTYSSRDSVKIEIDLGLCEISSSQILQQIGLGSCPNAILTVSSVGLNSSRNVDLINTSTNQIIDNFIVQVTSKLSNVPSTIVVPLGPSDCLSDKSLLLDHLNVVSNAAVRANVHFVAGTARVTTFPIGDTVFIDRIVCGDGYIYRNNVKVIFKPSLPVINGINYNYNLGFTTQKVTLTDVLTKLRADNIFPYSCDVARYTIGNRGPYSYGTHTIGDIFLDKALIASNVKVNILPYTCPTSLINLPLEVGQCFINKKDILDTLGFDSGRDNYGLIKLNILNGKSLEDDFFTIGSIQVDGYNVCNNPISVTYVRTNSIANEGNLACNNLLNISLDENCEVHLNSDVLLSGNYNCYLNYVVKVQDQYGRVVAEDHNVIISQVGIYQVTIKDPHNNNSCWSQVNVEDKHIYDVVCPPDTVPCYYSLLPDSLGIGPVFPDVGTPSVFKKRLEEGLYDVENGDYCGIKIARYTDRAVAECQGLYKNIIDRHWTFEDAAGNTDTCTQRLYVLKTLLDSVDQFQTIQKDCNSDFTILDDRGHPSPEVSGYPTINGRKYRAGVCGVLKMNYTDNVFKLCGKSFKILRDWTIIDWCSDQLTSRNQIILIEDRKPPVITNRLQDLYLNTDPFICGAENIQLPVPRYSDCGSDTVSLEIFYETFNAKNERKVVSNGSSLIIPIVTMQSIQMDFSVYYKLTDECGNIVRDTINVNIRDNQPPVAVCDQHTSISIAGNGLAQVKAFTFDDLSVDNCGIAKYEARKLNGSCHVDTAFTELLLFCCDEVGQTITVEFKVTDLAGNFNTCMVTVQVFDKFIPVITCPRDLTIDCSADYDDLTVTGRATAVDNCVIDSLYYVDDTHIDDCGRGWIKRTWRAVDRVGQYAECQQHITVQSTTPFVMSSSRYPRDTTINGCLQTISPAYTGSPDLIDTSCSQIISSYEDTYFYNVNNACAKIIRDWIVLDWCQFSTSNPSVGRWTKSQVIVVKNNTAPEFINTPLDTTICSHGTTCTDRITLTAFAEDDCTPAANLDWFYEFYRHTEDNTPSQTGTKSSFSQTLSPGRYKIKFTVSDGCKNYKSQTTTFEVVDCVAPNISCSSPQAPFMLDNTGQVEISLNDLNFIAIDNCTSPEALQYSFSPGEQTSLLRFNCSDIVNGQSRNVPLSVYVSDQNGNQSACSISVVIADNGSNICQDTTVTVPPGGTLVAQGLITTEELESVADVMVSITGPNGQSKSVMTDDNGKYLFSNLINNSDYTVNFSKGGDINDGMTTLDLLYIQRHILGLRVLDSPYKVIAADIDNNGLISGADLVKMRRMITGIDKDLSNGQKIWRFINYTHRFDNPYRPFPFPESVVVNKTNNNLTEANMMAIKIGDVNGSNKISSGLKAKGRSASSIVFSLVRPVQSTDQTVTVPVYSNAFYKATGLEFFIDLGDAHATISSGQITIAEDNYHQDKNGMLRFSWTEPYEGLSLSPEAPLFFINIDLSATQKSIKEVLNMNNLDPASAIIDAQLTEHNLTFQLVDSSNPDIEISGAPKIISSTPNPFSISSKIMYQVNQDEEVIIAIYDARGKQILQKKLMSFKGLNTFYLNEPVLDDYKGILLIGISNKERNTFTKLIKL